MAIQSVNPASGEILRTFEPLTNQAIEEKLQAAQAAFHSWKSTPPAVRAAALSAAAAILETEKRKLGEILTLEMGKTLTSAIAEVEKCALGCRYYAEHGESILAPKSVATAASKSYVQYRPLGAILAVMPWNFPFWQVFRFAAPALMAGNVGLLKHASNVPQCALAIEDIFLRAGVPAGVFQTLLVEAAQVEMLLKDDRVAAVTLTGSEAAGRSIAGISGSQIKKTVLELGGSDPFIVMPSADLEETAGLAVKARTINNGQSCIAAKRFIVADAIYEDFERLFVAKMAALRVGDPMLESTEVGPLATPQILKNLQKQVDMAVAAGAVIKTGSEKLPGPGNYYAPTVLTGVPIGSPIYYEEIFGPVAMLFRVADRAQAVRVANDSPFGLGSSVWTKDPEEQDYFVQRLEAGSVFVNAMVASDPRLPFGGIKRSGYGRELADVGMREFVNIQTVWVK
ncbi:MAG: NAD-dependent succinate-semialdehyde dehydrogenase [Bryobacteraceae bacterium]